MAKVFLKTRASAKAATFVALAALLCLVQCQGVGTETLFSPDDLEPEDGCDDLPHIANLVTCKPKLCSPGYVTLECFRGAGIYTIGSVLPACPNPGFLSLFRDGHREEVICVQPCGGISECCQFCGSPEYSCGPVCLTPAQERARLLEECRQDCHDLLVDCVFDACNALTPNCPYCGTVYGVCNRGCNDKYPQL